MIETMLKICSWLRFHYCKSITATCFEQDGQDVKPSERIAASQAAASIRVDLLEDVQSTGVDIQEASAPGDDQPYDLDNLEETGCAPAMIVSG